MRKSVLAILLNCILPTAYCQQTYWQQEVNYTIDVSLNDKEHVLDGFERIEYINNSPDTLHFIWFHIWPNAYKNDKTAFSDQLLGNGRTDFYFSDKEEKGYINRLDFKVNNITAETEDHPEHIDIIKLILPAPLPPSQKIAITTPFHVRIPSNFSRSGHDGQSYQATQWYPKPAVYDRKGWHPMPYLDQGEFYSEFGSFDVSITVPENYVVAATGELQDQKEKEWLKTRSSFSWVPQQTRVKTTGGQLKTITQKFPPSSPSIKTLRFRQDRIHDFAWFADKRFMVEQDTCRLSSGKIITVASYYYKQAPKNFWDIALHNIKRTVRFYSAQLGEYPYNTITAVQGPEAAGDIGGMEYPTITVLSDTKDFSGAQTELVHELGHNWLYGILGTNERDYAWMDEGMNTFYEDKYSRKRSTTEKLLNAYFQRTAVEKTDQPISTPSAKFNEYNYYVTSYTKAAEWMRYLEAELGTDVFNKAMQEYYRRWQFKHPQPEDFRKVMEDVSGKDLDAVFAYLDKKGALPNQQEKGSTFIFLPPQPHTGIPDKLMSRKTTYWISPAIGFNSYDKFMIGAMFSNIKVVPSKFQFLLIPMYATRTKHLNVLSFVNYSFYPDGLFRKIDLGISSSTFSNSEFKKEDGKKIYFGFDKYVPRLRLTFKEKDPRSTMHRYIQLKTYLLGEAEYRVHYDSIITPTDTTLQQVVRGLSTNRTLNQFTLVIEDYRALYPYRGELKIEQGEDFVRAAFTGKYYFNYAKKGGLDVRFFAGKFFYTTAKTISKQFNTDRYHLNMTGANGYEDYTYSDYFIGRNKFEGLASQQIMVRDGAFKVRTDLLGDKVGKTDDWLIAANFSSTIPSGINPLSLLPVKIPLKFFVDIGTYADAWKRESNEDRFLFDAGIQVPLLKETVNIYFPLLYSKVFKDYKLSYLPKKNRFWKMVSFSIDISNFSFRKTDRNLSF